MKSWGISAVTKHKRTFEVLTQNPTSPETVTKIHKPSGPVTGKKTTYGPSGPLFRRFAITAMVTLLAIQY